MGSTYRRPRERYRGCTKYYCVCIWQPTFLLGRRIRFEGSLIFQNHGLWRRAIFVSSISSSPEPTHHWVSEHRSFCNRGANPVILQSGAKRMVRSVDAALSKSGTPCGALYGDTSTVRGQQQQFDTSTAVHGACENAYRRTFCLQSTIEDYNNIRALRLCSKALSTYALSPTLVCLCESGWSDLSCRNQFLIPKIR